MRLINTDAYKEIIKDVQIGPFGVSIEWKIDDIPVGLKTLVTEVKTERRSGNIFVMDNNMRMKMREQMIDDDHPINFQSGYLGHQIHRDPDMIPECVLFIDPDYVSLSGRVLGIERIGVIDFSDTEQVLENDR